MRARPPFPPYGVRPTFSNLNPFPAMTPLLQLEDLHITFATPAGQVQAVRGADLELHAGETLAIVGESGCGKSVLCRSILRLLPDNARISGRILLEGRDIVPCSERQMRAVRGPQAAMLFQDPMASLNPTLPVGDQIMEALRRHRRMRPEQARQRAVELLELVGIDDSEARMRLQPHYFSGGMRQRCVLAIALALGPRILLADEPTTALDVTIQAQVLALIEELRQKLGTSMIMISHDLGVVVRTCDDVAIMYAGEIIEYGSVEQIYSPGRHHPYTVGLFGAIPNIRSKAKRLIPIDGLMPDPTNLPEGCKFSPRCPHCTDICRQQEPPVHEQNGHCIKCHLLGGDEG